MEAKVGPQHVVDKFCEGVVVYGPFFEHVLGYKKESLKRPEKFFFITYEELKSYTNTHVTRLAEFLGVLLRVRMLKSKWRRWSGVVVLRL